MATDGQFCVYLAGPITGLSFDDCVNWREAFIEKLPPAIMGLSPLRGKDYLESEKEVASDYAHMVLSCERGITTRDYNDVKRSDLLVVNLLGATKVSIGTVMEIAWAKAFQIPVILIIEKDGNIHDHPMIRDSIGFRVDSVEEALWLTKVILLPAPHRKNSPVRASSVKTIIVAYNERLVIGNNMGLVPWHIPEDLKLFKEMTLGNPCIMGRKTWDSIPDKFKPLPGRMNIIVSRDVSKVELKEEWDTPVAVLPSVEEAVEYAEGLWPGKEICIIGGGQIYQYCIEKGLVDRVLASEIKNHLNVDGATFFPDLKSLGWTGKVFREYPQFTVVEYTK